MIASYYPTAFLVGKSSCYKGVDHVRPPGVWDDIPQDAICLGWSLVGLVGLAYGSDPSGIFILGFLFVGPVLSAY
jgi:hypothetical protein